MKNSGSARWQLLLSMGHWWSRMVWFLFCRRLFVEVFPNRARIFKLLRRPRSDSKGPIFGRLCSLAGRYDNPIPTRLLAPVDCLKIPAQFGASCLLTCQSPNNWSAFGGKGNTLKKRQRQNKKPNQARSPVPHTPLVFHCTLPLKVVFHIVFHSEFIKF